MPERTIVIAVVLLSVGAALRFNYYFVLGQFLMKLLIGLSIVIFITFIVLSLVERRSRTYKEALVFAAVVALLFGLAYESAASNKSKNQKYLQRLSVIVNRYIEKNHKVPETFGKALDGSGELLPNRGDADGNSLMYIRFSDRIYLLRSFGSNRKNEFGSGDDAVVNYLNGNYVSSKELTSWIESNGTPEEKMMLEQCASVCK